MRPYSSYNRTPEIAPGEKIIAAASYLTTGIVGFLWIIISHVSKSRLRNFLRFHIYQSIFLAIIYYVFTLIMNILIGVVIKIPFIGSVIYSAYFYVFDFKMIFGYSIVDFAILLVVLYLAINALFGKIGKLPWVTNIIKSML